MRTGFDDQKLEMCVRKKMLCCQPSRPEQNSVSAAYLDSTSWPVGAYAVARFEYLSQNHRPQSHPQTEDIISVNSVNHSQKGVNVLLVVMGEVGPDDIELADG